MRKQNTKQPATQAVSVQRLVSCTRYDKKKCPARCEHSKPHAPIQDIYDDGKGCCNQLHGTCGYRSDQPKCICAANDQALRSVPAADVERKEK